MCYNGSTTPERSKAMPEHGFKLTKRTRKFETKCGPDNVQVSEDGKWWWCTGPCGLSELMPNE